jgi:hypothetical protein
MSQLGPIARITVIQQQRPVHLNQQTFCTGLNLYLGHAHSSRQQRLRRSCFLRTFGALALSKEKAIVLKLSAIEEMAGVGILCSGKTGTLTKNQLTLADPIMFAAKSAQDCILAAGV